MSQSVDFLTNSHRLTGRLQSAGEISFLPQLSGLREKTIALGALFLLNGGQRRAVDVLIILRAG